MTGRLLPLMALLILAGAGDGSGPPLDPASAAEWAWRSAQQGDVIGMTYVGRFLLLGEKGMAPDPQEARGWIERAARDHAPAQFTLGQIYDRGIGVPVDRERAIEWFSRAATSTRHPQTARDAQRALDRLRAR